MAHPHKTRQTSSFWYKMGYMWLSSKMLLSRYVGTWALNESSSIFSGIGSV